MRITLGLAVVVGLTSLANADREPAPAAKGAPAQRPTGLKDPFASEADMPPQRPRPPMPRVVVAGDVAKLGKTLAGTYTCKGVSLRGDGSSTPMEAKLIVKLDLDNAWLVESLAETKPGGVKFDDYRTFDATAKQWTKIQLANTSAHVIATSIGEKDGKWTWEGTATSPNGTTQVRDYEQLGGKQIKVWGEALLSGTWQKMYEATCKQ